LHAIYTGIDVSKRELICQFMNQDGDILRPILTVDNNRQGAMELAETIKSLAAGLTDPAVHLGMEATNAYWYHAEQLLRRQLVGLAPRIYVLNPAVIRGFKRSYTALPKTDAVDAWVIADRLHFGRPSPLGHCHRVRRPQADDPISLSAVHHPAERKAKGAGPDLSEVHQLQR